MRKYILLIAVMLFATGSAVADSTTWQVGPHAAFAFPSSFHAYGRTTGEGLGAKIIYTMKKYPFIKPRLDILYLSYGEDRSSLQGAASPYMMVQSRYESFQASLGFHFTRDRGKIQPYLSPMLGIFNYRTVVTLPELYYYYGYPAMDERDSQWKWGARVQTGAMFDIGLGPYIDFGLTYQRIYNVESAEINKDKRGMAEDIMINLGVMIPLDTK